MSIPLIMVGAAGAALLFAGSKGKSSAATSTDAAPTNQSTGGDNGGATSPSHAGSEATNDVNETTDSMPDSSSVIADPGPDTWAPSSGPSLDQKIVSQPNGGLKAIGTVGGLAARAAADSFQALANQWGAIW